MNDYQYNFYDVVAEAERHFEQHGKDKGSGYKGFLRWKYENEGKFGPSGDRSQISPFFAENGFREFVSLYGITEKTNSGTGWKDLGPYSANAITTGYNPGIGRVETFFVDPNNEGRIYLGARGGGFWVSNDTGNTWANTTDFLISAGVSSIAASPTHTDSVLISIRNARNNASHGVYRSTDAGQTWDSTDFVPSILGWGGLGTNDQIYKIAISPHNSNHVYVGTSEGLYRSTNSLQTWLQVTTTGNIKDIEFHPTKPHVVYMYDINNANRNYVFRSLDTGKTFTLSNIISGNNSTNTGHIAVSNDEPNWLFFASNNGVWKSTDEGINFSFLSNPASSCDGFAVSDTSVDYMTYGYVDNFRSTDGGSSFTQYSWWYLFNQNTTNDNYVHADTRTAECINGKFYIGTDGYLCRSDDNCLTWKRLSDGTGIREFYRVGVSPSRQKLNMCGSQDNGTSILNDTGWVEWNGGDGMEAVIQSLNEDWMIGSWQYGNRNRTINGGLTRKNIKHSGDPYWDAPMFVDPNHHMRVYSFADSVYLSEEFGDNWVKQGEPSFNDFIRDATIAQNNSDLLFVAAYSNIERSMDRGQTFTNVKTSTLTNQFISDIATDPRRDSTVIITYDHHWDYKRIFISYDLGHSWQNISYNLNKIPIRNVVIDREGNIYLGAEIGVYTMPIGGTQWSLYNADLPNVAVSELEIQQATNTLRAATWGRGLWEAPLLGKADFPKITSIDAAVKPTMDRPMQGDVMDIEAVISYSGVLTKVYIQWSANSPDFNYQIDMNKLQDSTWKTLTPIPDQPADTDVYFKVFAVGNNGDTTESDKLMYTVHSNPAFGLYSQDKQDFKIYPNPSSGMVTIELNQDYNQVDLSVRDMTGKEVYTRKTGRVRRIQLDLSSLSTGSYLIHIETEGKSENHKIILQPETP